VDQDLAVAAAVREAVGPGFPLTWDNYHTYTYEQALRVGRELQELDYGWLESPMPEREDWLDAYVRLAKELDIPVCAPETLPGTHLERIRWQRRKAMDINRIDLKYGGFTACYLLAKDCEENGVKLELHAGGHRILNVAACFSDAVIEHYEHHDPYPEASARRFAEIDASHPGAATAVANGGHLKNPLLPPTLDGYQRVPQEPGLGMELDWDYIREHAVAS
jgi:L-alanine-DL-glutamate epimerase-like enolase superfamily enzyme